MAKKGVKVKDLAKELCITSRSLIDRCRAEGIAVQNSITKLDERSASAVRSWFAGGDALNPSPSQGEGRG